MHGKVRNSQQLSPSHDLISFDGAFGRQLEMFVAVNSQAATISQVLSCIFIDKFSSCNYFSELCRSLCLLHCAKNSTGKGERFASTSLLQLESLHFKCNRSITSGLELCLKSYLVYLSSTLSSSSRSLAEDPVELVLQKNVEALLRLRPFGRLFWGRPLSKSFQGLIVINKKSLSLRSYQCIQSLVELFRLVLSPNCHSCW